MTPEEEAYYQVNIGDLLDQIHKQAEEIKRLEDALVEERARRRIWRLMKPESSFGPRE